MTLIMKILGLAATATLLTGCADYLARHDGVTFDAGDAAARNAAIHMIDPWPRHAANTRIEGDGKRMNVAINKYQANEPEGAATKTGTANAAPSSQNGPNN